MIFSRSKSSLMAFTAAAPFRFPSTLCRLPRPGLQIGVHLPYHPAICPQNRNLRLISTANLMSQPTGGLDDGASKNNGATAENPEDVVVQYVVLRRDLIEAWPLGSVVTQGCHASVAAIWSYKDDSHTLQYCNPQNIDSMHKVTLEVKGETQMVNLSEKLKAGGIAHKLWIEQPENTPTCIATKPYPKSQVSSFFKKLKLCK